MPVTEYKTNSPSSQQAISEEMSDFISNKPHWIVTRGNTIFFLLLLAFISFSWLVEYPDIIIVPMRIVAINSPKLLTSKKEGKLVKLLVKNDEYVHTGQPLAYLESTAAHEQVIKLYKWIESVEPLILKDSLEIVLHRQVPANSELGELQTFYQDFENTLKETQQVIGTGFYQRKKKYLMQDLAFLKASQDNTLKQKDLTNKDLKLQKIEYEAKEKLARDKVISPLEFNQDKSKLLGKEQNIELFNAQIISNNITTNNKQQELQELQKSIKDQEQKFHSAVYNLKSRIKDWVYQYIVYATTDGQINFVSYLQENQYLQNSQEMFYIIPPTKKFYGELKASQTGIGKIKTGQTVIIRLNSFPSTEFGYLTGIISYIPALVKNDSSILIKVDFTNGLKTNYGRDILFKNNLNASAEIITDNRRLPERLLGQFREIFHR